MRSTILIRFHPSIVLLAVVVGTAILTYMTFKPAGMPVGLRVSEEVEIEELDAATRCTVDLATECGASDTISGRESASCLSVSARHLPSSS